MRQVLLTRAVDGHRPWSRSESGTRIGVYSALLGWLVAALLVPAGAAIAREEIHAGQPLREVLSQLTQAGLKLVFTDRVVPPGLRVKEAPTARDARGILDQLLLQHDLGVREAAGGTLIVVPVEQLSGQVAGTVQEWRSGRPLPDVEVRLPDGGEQGLTDSAGHFRLEGVRAGRRLLAAARPGYVVQETEIRVRPDATTELAIELRPTPLTIEQIDVAARRPSLLDEGVSTLSLGRGELTSLPSLGEDVLRPLTSLPGTTGNDVSAQVHVRGGRSDEVMVQVDGHELLEPYHLKDFGSALSSIAPEVIGSARLITGGFPAQYGDRMGGVLDLTSRVPRSETHRTLALSVLHAEAGGSGPLPGDRGQWLGTLRYGALDLAASVAEEERDPSFADAFVKIGWARTPSRSFRGYTLLSSDRLDFAERLGDLTSGESGAGGDGDERQGLVQFATRYFSGDLWGSHQAVLQSGLSVETRASLSRVQRDRRGDEVLDTGELSLRDGRKLDVVGLAQAWSLRRGDVQDFQWGFEARALDVDYDYRNQRSLSDPLAVVGFRPPQSSTTLDRRFSGEQLGAYVTGRMRLGAPLTLELGLRFDENTILDDEYVSPRSSLTYQLGADSRLTAAWGHFYQSQRVYELQVEDGEARFFPSERSEHRILGFEHSFSRDRDPQAAVRRREPLTLRVELYEHRIRRPRPRYENLFDPISLVPEAEADRFRIAPESALAQGIELLLSAGGRRWDAFMSYSRARIEDRVGGRDVPRAVDQRDAFKLDFAYRTPGKWDFSVAAEVRSGWPTTALRVELVGDGDDPAVVPVIGPVYGERLGTYRRLDGRVSRHFSLRRGELEVYLDVQNLTNARNIRGFEFSFEVEDGGVRVVRDDKLWSRLVPSFGLRWSF